MLTQRHTVWHAANFGSEEHHANVNRKNHKTFRPNRILSLVTKSEQPLLRNFSKHSLRSLMSRCCPLSFVHRREAGEGGPAADSRPSESSHVLQLVGFGYGSRFNCLAFFMASRLGFCDWLKAPLKMYQSFRLFRIRVLRGPHTPQRWPRSGPRCGPSH